MKKSRNFKNAIFVFIIAFSSFFAFEPLFEHLGQKAAQEFTAAIFGTIFAAVITMVLLNKQTETEEERSRSEKVFEQKVNLYNQILDYLQMYFQRINAKNEIQIDSKEITELEFLLAKLLMLGDEKTIKGFKVIYQNILNGYSPENGTLNVDPDDKYAIFRFSDYCREELGLSDKNLEKDFLEDIVLYRELFPNLNNITNPDVINTIKDIFGYIIFDLELPVSKIKFSVDGFIAYTNRKHTYESKFAECNVYEDKIELTLTDNLVIKEFTNSENTKTMCLNKQYINSRKTTLPKIEKLIRQSYRLTNKI